MTREVLVVDDDIGILRVLRRSLERAGYVVEVAEGGPAGIAKLDRKVYDALVVDLLMPEIDGFDVMKHALRNSRSNNVLVITGEGSIPVAVEAMRAGATDFLTKPLDDASVPQALERIFRTHNAHEEHEDVLAWRDRYAPDIVGDHPRLVEVLRIMQKVARTDCDILISGASGTGKELIARGIHHGSHRNAAPFVPLNCAAIPKELVESEIFGYAKGAFTGAHEAREGKFQAADGGTLFLDEVGEMELGLQGKFLRVIQERELTPVGSSVSRQVNVRIVSATNQDIEARCQDGSFREDLFYRLNVIPIESPTLKERSSDVPLLAEHFIELAARRHGRDISGIESDARDLFVAYDWPGNIRELKNLVERVVVLKSGEGPIAVADLPHSMVGAAHGQELQTIQLPEGGVDLNDALAKVEMRLTLDALKRSGGNKAKAAELLGLKRTTLVERLKKLKISEEQFKTSESQ